MTATTSQIFDFFERNSSCTLEKYEVVSASFSVLRQSLRQMILGYRESDGEEEHAIADRIQSYLSEWLTAPVPFDNAILGALDFLGEADSFERKWGRDMRLLYDSARNAAGNMTRYENPVCIELREIFADLKNRGVNFRIYCHRAARFHYSMIMKDMDGLPFGDDVFLHSLRDYRQTSLFDALVKIGPLRSRGWGNVPDALLSAPRFATLVQLVWSGCADEPEFGYDPVSAVRNSDEPATGPLGADELTGASKISWKTVTLHSGNDEDADTSENLTDADEFQIFRGWDTTGRMSNRRATLVQIDGEHGILYSPHSRVLSFDPMSDGSSAIDRRLPGETLSEGMFVLRPILDDFGLDGPEASHGYFSQIWKLRLNEVREQDHDGLVARLRSDGLDLVHLSIAISHWCRPPTTVIHAPQQKKHFLILIRTLRIDFAANGISGSKRQLTWEHAWQEICRSRGEAIQAGVHGHDDVDEKLCCALTSLLPSIRHNAVTDLDWAERIPDGLEVQGVVLFHRVRAIEDGYFVPPAALKRIHDLNEVEQWRV